jgi:hypothetical protein
VLKLKRFPQWIEGCCPILSTLARAGLLLTAVLAWVGPCANQKATVEMSC